MAQSKFWTYVFCGKGVINWVESIGLLFVDPWLRTQLNLPALVNTEYAYLFVALAFIFGIGYWQVGKNLTENHEVIRMGVYGQYSVFSILTLMIIVGQLHWVYVVPALIDGLFASLYLWYLLQVKSVQTSPS